LVAGQANGVKMLPMWIIIWPRTQRGAFQMSTLEFGILKVNSFQIGFLKMCVV
jgi:hypothetical protein